MMLAGPEFYLRYEFANLICLAWKYEFCQDRSLFLLQ
jgi:hypothetical protein